MTRKITPHKGNRIVRLHTLATVATANQIQLILAQRSAATGKRYSLADWIAEKAAEEVVIIAATPTRQPPRTTQ